MSEALQGADALMRKLQKLSGPEAKKALRKGTRAGAKIVAAKDRELVPRLTGTMARKIKVRALKRSRKRFGHTVRADVPYVGFVNYGTRSHKGQGTRSLNRAAQQVGRRALQAVQDTAAEEIPKLAAAG